MNKVILTYLIGFCFLSGMAQVSVGHQDPKSLLDIDAVNPGTPTGTDGILIPRLTNFPSVDPATDQEGLLVFLDNTTPYAGRGFYYWDDLRSKWIALGDNLWTRGQNGNGDDLIYAIEPDRNGIPVVVTNDGFIGLGTDTPDGELHVYGIRTEVPELIVENRNFDAEILLTPGNSGSPGYTLVANKETSDGFSIYEDNTEQLTLQNGGAFTIADLNLANNPGVDYPVKLRVVSDGSMGVQTSYSAINSVKANAKNFSSVEMCETLVPYGIAVTSAFYTYVVTPTQDVLLEMSYRVGATINGAYDIDPPTFDVRHDTKLYGVVVRVNGVDYVTTSDRYVGNDGLRGYFYLSDHMYIPLVADGTTYTIALHGHIQNGQELEADPDWGLRGTFGGDPEDRIQIIEHK